MNDHCSALPCLGPLPPFSFEVGGGTTEYGTLKSSVNHGKLMAKNIASFSSSWILSVFYFKIHGIFLMCGFSGYEFLI